MILRRLCFVCLALTLTTPARADTPPTRPNVVFVLADDLRWDCLGSVFFPTWRPRNLFRARTLRRLSAWMVRKRTMHEPSIRVPLVVRYPKLTAKPGKAVEQMVLHVDLAPSLLELCGAEALPNVHGKSWVKLVRGESSSWRTSWFYEYNYEKQFPYTPNVRGVRTDRWKYVRYPHGDGSPDRHLAELYDLSRDPDESKNLVADKAHAGTVKELQGELLRLMKETGIEKDEMPIDAGIKKDLPDLKIR